MSREKTESVLKIIVKHFFIEKEVTSTLVMDSLHSGLKALQGPSKKPKGKYLADEEQPVPIVRIEKDVFVLVEDVLLLLERAAIEPLPANNEKGPQNRTKDVGLGATRSLGQSRASETWNTSELLASSPTVILVRKVCPLVSVI
nr:PREDICTED: MATH domain-containing protein At5g43560-like [Daucus carota subsp. sativus]